MKNINENPKDSNFWKDFELSELEHPIQFLNLIEYLERFTNLKEVN